MNVWDQIKQQLAPKLTVEAFQNWLERTSLAGTDGTTIRVTVPDEATREWVHEEYGEEITLAIRELKLPFSEVAYEIGPIAARTPAASNGNGEKIFASATTQLNPKFTFESFVVGSCNQFAHAAAEAVATMPARNYNPLLIYGGTGMGKTHLMHAIGHLLLESFPDMRVAYTTSERFMNQLIHCIRTDKLALFHDHYRKADILLVDDIQLLADRERTQEEFFHTFNELYDHQKQIVISSDAPPKDTPGLVERLRSRFEWGLMVDVQPPDLETKMAILDRKAEIEGVVLPDDVRIHIATKTRSSVRELEGALVKLIAYSSVTGEPITLAMAKQTLNHLGGAQEKRVSIDAIIRKVAERFELTPAQLKQKSNTHKIAYPRQIAMYIIKEMTPASLPEIGRAFAGKHHTTVLHSIQKIDRLRHTDVDLNRLIHSLIDSLS